MDATITSTSTTTPLPPIPVSVTKIARRNRDVECKRRAPGCCAAIRAHLVATLTPETERLQFAATDEFWCDGLKTSNEFKALCDEFKTMGGWSLALNEYIEPRWENGKNVISIRREFYVTAL